MSRGRTDGDYGHRGLPGQDQDEDYDWIKYLGEGRAASPGGQVPGGQAPGGQASRLRRGRQQSGSGHGIGAGRADPAGRQAPARDVSGGPASGRGDRRADVVPPVPSPAGDYSRPLYDGPNSEQPIPVPTQWPPQQTGRPAGLPAARVDARLDTSEYIRPLYPPDDTGPVGRPGRRRPEPPSQRMAPPAIRPYPAAQPDDTDPRPLPQRPLPQRSLPQRPMPDGRGVRPAPATAPELPGRPGGPDRSWLPGEPDDDGAQAPRGPQARDSGRSAAVPKAAGPVTSRRPDKPAPAKPRGGVKPGVAAKSRVAVPRPAAMPRGSAPRRQAGTRRQLSRTVRRLPRRVMILSGCLIVAVVAAAAYLLLAPKPAHVVSTPSRLGAFARETNVDSSTAQGLRNKIVAGAAGEVKNVVAAVYEQTTGPGTSQGPQIVVFIGGNLTGGGSASGFITGFVTELHGTFTTNPGRLHGLAACAPGSNGGPAECAWADDDTFGVVVSATLSAEGLANEMRLMRPQIEHAAK